MIIDLFTISAVMVTAVVIGAVVALMNCCKNRP